MQRFRTYAVLGLNLGPVLETLVWGLEWAERDWFWPGLLDHLRQRSWTAGDREDEFHKEGSPLLLKLALPNLIIVWSSSTWYFAIERHGFETLFFKEISAQPSRTFNQFGWQFLICLDAALQLDQDQDQDPLAKFEALA